MNKLMTGAIAAAAGVALLMGGAGTFAYWNSSTTPASTAITAGNLLVADSGTAGVWKSGSTTIDPSTYRVSPGDNLTYTKTMSITARGNALTATLSLAPAAITAADAANAADVALAGYLTKSASLSASGTGIVAGTGSNAGTYTITPGATGVAQNVTITVAVTFPKDASSTANNDAKLGAVSLSGMAVTLTQN